MSADSGPTRLVQAHGSPSQSLMVRRFRLVVASGPDRGRSFEAEGDRVAVGTVPGADLVLTDRTVSRIHMEVAAREEGFLLRDLGSTNGTWLEGYRVKEVYLRDGARLGLGQSEVVFQVGEGESDHALSASDRFGPLVGASPPMRRLFATLARVAPTDATVLVQGETGTGKELVARGLHEHSPRRGAPFVVVDGGSLPASLVESELFGHEKGAFTGAAGSRLGAVAEADGGTVFLDEIGELPLDLQPKLLRVLESREVRRVGANAPRKVDVRVVAATNRDLREAVNRGTFRADLYYRLAVVTVSLPPLRERDGDVPLLARRFLDDLEERLGRRFEISDGTLARLARLPWHGNVRELRNFVERSVFLAEDGRLATSSSLEPGVLPDPAGPGPGAGAPAPGPAVETELPYKVAKSRWTDHFEEVYLAALLDRCGGNVSKAAREAEMDRAYLFRLLRRYGLKD